MPYTAEISRANPSCFLFVIDQSGSMRDVVDPKNIQKMETPVFVDGRTYTHMALGRTKAQGVSDAINRWLRELVLKCTKDEGPRDYYDVGVIGYGAQVGPALGGPLTGRELVSIQEIANSPARIEDRSKKTDDGKGGLVEQKIRFPIWFDPVAENGTPMCQALTRAGSILAEWVSQNTSSFPPTVIHITDGESDDGDPPSAAEGVRSLATDDGNVFLFNVHLSSQKAAPIEFPDTEVGLPDQYARLLFRISSLLPDHIREAASQAGIPVSDGTRGFSFNADMVAFINFLNIGTRPGNLR
ncbi:MAG: VWA domain-containing protein [Chloroflexi bacterium]|nr:VWA domain-containing protein [Chloroflexota bacterium]